MARLNPNAVLLIVLWTVIGAVVGHVLIGLLVGLGLEAVATIAD